MNPMSHAKALLNPKSYLAAFVFIGLMVAKIEIKRYFVGLGHNRQETRGQCGR